MFYTILDKLLFESHSRRQIFLLIFVFHIKVDVYLFEMNKHYGEFLKCANFKAFQINRLIVERIFILSGISAIEQLNLVKKQLTPSSTNISEK